MFSLTRQRKAARSALGQGCARAAFTLVEIVISLAVLGTMASGVYIGFNAINAFAVSSRLYSEALTAAQNEVDLVLSKAPFDTSAAYVSGSFNPALGKIPPELMTTTELDAAASAGVIFPSAPPTSTPATTSSYYPYYPYYRDGTTPNTLKKQAFIYQDPVSGTTIVTGTLSVTVTDPGLTMTYLNSLNNNVPWQLNTRKATATVTYTYRNRSYTVSLDTMRTADQ